MIAAPMSAVVVAPSHLNAEARIDFKCAALDCLDRVVEIGGDELAIDMAETREVDASGLGVLVLVYKRARERGVMTRLLHAGDPVRALLMTTRLEPLFRYDRFDR
jgi:anti-anti-sigma regulatory factor